MVNVIYAFLELYFISPYLRGLRVQAPPRNVGKFFFRTVKNMQQCDIRASFTYTTRAHLHDVWLKNVWQLERGQKLLKCQEKPYRVYKMQENAWRPGLRHGPRWGSLPPPNSLAGGEGAGCPLPKNTSPALGPSGLACLRPLILEPPKLKSWLRP